MYVLGLPKCSAHNSSLATSPRNRIGATEGDLQPFFLTFFGVSVESHFISELRWNLSLYPWSCRFVRPWFCRGLSLGKRNPVTLLPFRPVSSLDEEAWFCRKT